MFSFGVIFGCSIGAPCTRLYLYTAPVGWILPGDNRVEHDYKKNAYLTAISSGNRGAVCTDMSVWVKEKVSNPEETSSKLEAKWK